MNTVVYYPHVYPSPEWLKLAALCWDKVYTLSPYENFDFPYVIRALDDTLGGILESVYVQKIALEPEVQTRFITWMKAHYDELRVKGLSDAEDELNAIFYAEKISNPILEILRERGLIEKETKSYEEKFPKWELPSEWGLSKKEALEYTQFHPDNRFLEAPYIEPVLPPAKPGSDREKYEKLQHKIEMLRYKIMDAQDDIFGINEINVDDEHEKRIQELEEEANRILQRNLVTETREISTFYLPKHIGLHYLSVCAAKIAHDSNRDLVAQAEEFTGAVFHDVRAATGEIAASVLEAYLPESLSTVEPKRIAEVRSELTTNRLKYQKAIQSVINEYAAVASDGELGKVKHVIQEIARERVEDTKKAYKRAKLELAVKAFGITLTPPALASTLASVLGIGVFAPAGVAAAISVFAASRLLELDKAKGEKAKSPWSYVLDIGQVLE